MSVAQAQNECRTSAERAANERQMSAEQAPNERCDGAMKALCRRYDGAVKAVQLVGRKEAWLSITHDELLLPVKRRRTEACERAEASERVKAIEPSRGRDEVAHAMELSQVLGRAIRVVEEFGSRAIELVHDKLALVGLGSRGAVAKMHL